MLQWVKVGLSRPAGCDIVHQVIVSDWWAHKVRVLTQILMNEPLYDKQAVSVGEHSFVLVGEMSQVFVWINSLVRMC